MSKPAPRLHHHTYGEYLELEETSNVKHEFLDGEIYAMAGGTPDHAALAANVLAALHGQLAGRPCRVFTSDLRVRVMATGLATYPDVTVVCGEMERDPESRVTATNPLAIVEVLSDGTEDYDRGEKLQHYRLVPSLRAVLLVSHRARHVSSWTRGDDGAWSCVEQVDDGAGTLPAIGCELSLEEIYRGGLSDAPALRTP